jgi:hypothetical protein
MSEQAEEVVKTDGARKPSLMRRRALFGGAAAVAGAGAAAVIGGTPAHAADGDAVRAGQFTAATADHVTILQNDVGKALFGTTQGAIVGETLSATTGRAGVVGTTSLVGNVGVAARHSGGNNGAPLMIMPHGGLPTGGTHHVGEVVSLNGQLYVCVGDGTPGAWANVGFNPITPFRVLDTRFGVGLSGKQLAGDGNVRSVSIAGVGPIPSQAKAVALNLTITEPTAASFFTIWPAGVARPNASNINFVAGQDLANFANVKLGSLGRLSLYLNSGATHVIMDVGGYFV